MKRREFIRIGGATAAASAIPLAAFGGSLGERAVVEASAMPSSVHVLGPPAQHPDERLVKGLSNEVFARLVAGIRRRHPHRTLRLVGGSRPGDAFTEGVLQWQWNTSYKIPASFMNDEPPYFPIDHFWWATDRWIAGSMCCPRSPVYGDWQPVDDYADPFAIFDALRVAGMPHLPSDLPWAAHYVDEDTGLAMRALGYLDIVSDEFVCRWDVIGG